jgi:hypothetical protein
LFYRCFFVFIVRGCSVLRDQIRDADVGWDVGLGGYFWGIEWLAL